MAGRWSGLDGGYMRGDGREVWGGICEGGVVFGLMVEGRGRWWLCVGKVRLG